MTREEAIAFFKDMNECLYLEAVEMAIKALQQEPCEDCISRQAVIDIIEKEEFKGDALSEIEKLPSVKPTQNISIQITEREKYGRFN